MEDVDFDEHRWTEDLLIHRRKKKPERPMCKTVFKHLKTQFLTERLEGIFFFPYKRRKEEKEKRTSFVMAALMHL